MKVRLACFSLGLVVMAVPAGAADFGYGGGQPIETYQTHTAIPVPAPVPVPEFSASWYFRFDAGIGAGSSPDISGETDFLPNYPGDASGPDLPYSFPSSWFSSDFDTFLTLGAGVGYYFGNGWRMDATVEKRSKDDFRINGSDQWETWDDDGAGGYAVVDSEPNGTADTLTRVDMNEAGKLDGTVWLANLYYDFANRGGFTPYVGAGLGFVWHEISRNNTTSFSTCDNQGGPPTGCEAGTYTSTGSNSSSDRADKVSLAAAAMAGFSYDLTEITAIDVGYRYLYLQGTDAVLDVGEAQTRVEIGDQHVHQLRAGLRFNVN